MTIYPRQTVNAFWKYGPTPGDPTPHWYEFSYDGQTGAEIYPDRIVLHLMDGGRGDADLTANGRIQDPGAPALLGPSAALAGLRDQVVALGLSKGLETSLTKKIDNAARKLADGNTKAASAMLQAFINEVKALAKGRKEGKTAVLSADTAERLTYATQVIIDQIQAGLGKAGLAGLDAVPSQVSLDQNYPNPFNPATTIQFTLDQSAQVRLAVYDLLGRRVALLADGYREAGAHAVTFDATGLSTGTYFYRLETPQATLTRRLTVSK